MGRFLSSGSRRSFLGDRSGNVAMLWGLMGAVLVGLLGMSVDFTRAQSLRVKLQNASDGAVLVAERLSMRPLAERTEAARAFFNAEMGADADEAEFLVFALEDGGHRVTARLSMNVSLARLVKNEDWHIRVASEAMADASPPIEVVMALDNTGSMSNDMDTLREGAQTLAEFLLGLDGDSVSVGLVPFVAQANVGTAHANWIDQAGNNPYNGTMLEGRNLGYRPTSNGNSSGNCNGANYPLTLGGLPVRWIKGAGGQGQGATNTSRCYAFSPQSVNIWSLYSNLPANAQWGGCVEMRPPPYDITDDAPTTATPATMFVPFFSLDDGGDVSSPANNWITSNTYDLSNPFGVSSWTPAGSNVGRTHLVYKYRAGVPVSINTSNTSGRGPNRGCPTPIVPLTSDESTVVTAVQNMVHWSGGGTNQIEGLAWAWRVISPGAPFTEGRPYDDPDDPVRKVIVLFTDGDNTSLSNNNNSLQSDYAGIGYRSLYSTYQTARVPIGASAPYSWQAAVSSTWWRNGITSSSSTVVTYMNDRQEDLCNAIKTAGIEIYTIGFRITAGGTADLLLEDCATQDGAHYYHADNQAELLQAFDNIGSGIGALRLTH